MEAEVACVICNWYDGIGGIYYGFGGLGALGGGFFGGGGLFGGTGGFDDDLAPGQPAPEDQEDSADETVPDSRETRFRRLREMSRPTSMERASKAAQDWFDETFGVDRSPGFEVSGTSRETSMAHGRQVGTQNDHRQ